MLKGKRLLLWKEVLKEVDHPDAKAMDEVIVGLSMTGWTASSGVFQPDVGAPDIHPRQLEGMALGLNHEVVDALRNSEVSEREGPAWDETEKEIEQGWLAPCEVDNLRTVHVTRRFPLQQCG